jgi:fatty-acyl-CoA synthase
MNHHGAIVNKTNTTVSGAWMHALELTAPIPRQPQRILYTVLEERTATLGDKVAFLSDRESLCYRTLYERANRYARWSLAQKISKGDVVGLLMANGPEYLAIWLGITSVGGVVSLLNTNLAGASLAHCINVVSPRHLIVAEEFVETMIAALPDVQAAPAIWTHGTEHAWFRRIDSEIRGNSGGPLGAEERPQVTIEDRALYIYTSGTTGLPKAASVSHARVMQWSHWFAGMMGMQGNDSIYNCLPMYHSVGGVQVPGAAIVAGGSLVIREKFSASNFWNDVTRWQCTIFQYIGELCRYLLHAGPSANERKHSIRLACGNGMAPEVWEPFLERFKIPRVLEFYASTEGAVSLFNVEGKRGAIGRVPPYLAHRFAPALIRYDIGRDKPVRDEDGFCVRCAPNEVGEALGKIYDDTAHPGSRFEGYADPDGTEKKILRDVFERGDAWIRTGDLMRKDEKGFYYFVDRIGDTFRWKGENVATSEVSKAIRAFPGIEHAAVYGVKIPAADGRAGMATVVTTEDFDLPGFRRHMISLLPSYARPLFLRIRKSLDITGTFKYVKSELAEEGYDPQAITDYLYFDHSESEAFVPIDAHLYELIQVGGIRI